VSHVARESEYQAEVIGKIRHLLPDCIILKNDPSYMQGVPDLIILYKDCWAMLEIKRNARAHRQPNQDYYIELMNSMSFAAFLCPENEREVLHDLQLALRFAG
jgi:hypothetical protein